MPSNGSTEFSLTKCIICLQPFDACNRCPCTQSCQHSICLQCINSGRLELSSRCPLDGGNLSLSSDIYQPFSILLQENSSCTGSHLTVTKQSINYYLQDLAIMLKKDSSKISPQLKKRLTLLIQSTFDHVEGRYEFIRRLSSVMSRLLIELIQSHYNTKHREQDLLRLIDEKGCIIVPGLTDAVIDLLIKLYKAAGQCADTSFERKVLIKFLLKELGDDVCKKQVARVVQTLYKSSAFHIITMQDGSPARLRLREDLCNAAELRQQHDIELIKLAQSNHIRLSPESWAYLLYKNSYPDYVSRMQSLLDKHQNPPTVLELESCIAKEGDKYAIGETLSDLQQVQEYIEAASTCPTSVESEVIIDLMKKLTKSKRLFVIRQCRGQVSS